MGQMGMGMRHMEVGMGQMGVGMGQMGVGYEILCTLQIVTLQMI